MIVKLVFEVLLLSSVLTVAIVAAKKRTAPKMRDQETILRELDRLENVLRRDSHRDDVRVMYNEILSRVSRSERKRRRQRWSQEES